MFAPRPSCLALTLAALGAALLSPGTSHAHFVLQSPQAVYEQNALGDPQKAPPCGDAGGAMPTDLVTPYKAGDVVTITIDETIYHPGHYRIALAVNDISELPEEPPVTPNDTPCGTAPIQNPPVFPVLADGVFEHTEPFDAPQTIEVKLPDDLSCDNCTLQIIQFMSNHGLNNPGGCYYHHCAAISVEAGPVEGTTGEDESGSESEGTTGATTATTTTSPTTGATTAGTSDGESASGEATSDDAGTGSTAGATANATATDGGSTSEGATRDDDGGCGCSGAGGGDGLATLVGLFGLLGLRARSPRRPRAA